VQSGGLNAAGATAVYSISGDVCSLTVDSYERHSFLWGVVHFVAFWGTPLLCDLSYVILIYPYTVLAVAAITRFGRFALAVIYSTPQGSVVISIRILLPRVVCGSGISQSL